MEYFEVPLSANPQRFTITLLGTNYACLIYWNTVTSVWCLDLMDEDQVPLVTAIPMVAGTDLLGQHQHLGIGGHLVMQIDGDPMGDPTYQNLGSSARLIFSPLETT